MDKSDSSPTRTLTTPAADLARGTVVSGRYEVLEEVGAGGMGRVYRVLDREIQEEIALKILRPDVAADPLTLERFQNELKLARRISHKNVCRMYHLGNDRGFHYLLMEFVRGEDLRQTIRRSGGLPVSRAVAIGREICEGLGEAHRLGIVHRDLKPGNIVIDGTGHVRIMDFGIARAAGTPGLTLAGAMVGTPDYISPEQTEGKEADARSDLYSLGALLFELVTGRPPFEGESALSIALRHRSEPPPDPRSLNPDIPAEVGAVILKCLAKDPADRYQRAEELAAALTAAGADRPVRAGFPTSAGGRPEGSPGVLGRNAFRLSAFVAAAAVLAGGLFLLRSRRTPAVPVIAVLPLENISGNPGEDYFSDGITEDIITHLSKIRELRVISRMSAWKYRGTKKSIPEVGRELNATAVLEGSVRRDGDRVRITARLVDARKDLHLWAETYDRRMSDIFEVQSDVAAKIARELRVRLSPEDRKRLARRPTADIGAYAFYVRGREHYYKYTREDNEQAIALFRKAVGLDPDYALAYAGLADAYVHKSQAIGDPGDWLGEALRMAQKALAIDPALAEGYKALGLVQDSLGDPEAGLQSYYRAVELNPNYAPVVSNIGAMSFQQGRYDEALLWLSRAAELQPDISRFASLVSLQYYSLEFDALAASWAERALKLQPDSVLPRIVQSYLDLASQRIDAARQRLARVLEKFPDDTNALDAAGDADLLAGDYLRAGEHYDRLVSLTSWKGQPGIKLAYVLQKLGESAKAADLLMRNLEFSRGLPEPDRAGSPVGYYLAEIYAVQNQPAQAIEALNRAIENGYHDRWMSLDPLLQNIRREPRFADLMAKRRRRIEAMRRRVAGSGLDR